MSDIEEFFSSDYSSDGGYIISENIMDSNSGKKLSGLGSFGGLYFPNDTEEQSEPFVKPLALDLPSEDIPDSNTTEPEIAGSSGSDKPVDLGSSAGLGGLGSSGGLGGLGSSAGLGGLGSSGGLGGLGSSAGLGGLGDFFNKSNDKPKPLGGLGNLGNLSDKSNDKPKPLGGLGNLGNLSDKFDDKPKPLGGLGNPKKIGGFGEFGGISGLENLDTSQPKPLSIKHLGSVKIKQERTSRASPSFASDNTSLSAQTPQSFDLSPLVKEIARIADNSNDFKKSASDALDKFMTNQTNAYKELCNSVLALSKCISDLADKVDAISTTPPVVNISSPPVSVPLETSPVSVPLETAPVDNEPGETIIKEVDQVLGEKNVVMIIRKNGDQDFEKLDKDGIQNVMETINEDDVYVANSLFSAVTNVAALTK